MPKRKKSYLTPRQKKRSKRYRRRRSYKKYPNLFQRSALKRVEVKTYDNIFTANDIGYNGQYDPDEKYGDNKIYSWLPLVGDNTNNHQALNLVIQGTQVSQRIGTKITMKSLRLKLNIMQVNNPLHDEMPLPVRLLLVYDRQASCNVYPTMWQFIGGVNQLGAEVSSEIMLNTGNLFPRYYERYLIVRDWTFYTPGVETYIGQVPPDQDDLRARAICHSSSYGPAVPASSWCIDEYIDLKDLGTTYASNMNDGTIEMISTGALTLYWYTDSDVGQNNFYMMGTARLKFYDQ